MKALHFPAKNSLSIRCSLLILWTIVALCAAGQAKADLPADSVQTLFTQANQNLEEGYYGEALEFYHRIEGHKTVSGALFLNLGITYARLDSLGKAKYYLLKAQNYPSTRSAADEGLKFVNDQFSNQSAVLPKLPWQRAIDWLHDHWGAAFTFGVGFFVLMLGVSGILYSWFFRPLSFYINRAGRYITVGGVLIILLSLYINYIDYRYSRAVMTRQQTVVRQQPASDGTTISRAYEGYTFTVDLKKSRDNDGWYYVRLPNGMHGWIQKQNIKLL